ncbi:hypothetical protein [Streptomyces sp. NPDC056296]|uniref:hypothetical protein n=1 Tax=Streptomyces sp. NPDC056296 TaxID=3345775 RepID=UPI0035E103C6
MAQPCCAVVSRRRHQLLTVKKFLPLDELFLRDGMVIFMADPADAIWGFDPSAPMDVHEGKLHEGWRKLPEDFTEFLTHNAFGEATYNAAHTTSCDSVPNERMSDVLGPLTEVAFGEWNWPAPGHRIYVSDTVIAHVGPALRDGAPLDYPLGFSEVQVGTINPTDISYLHDIPETEWF